MNTSACNHSTPFAKTPLALAFTSLFLSTPASAIVVPANPIEAFYSSQNYTYCDAKLLSAYWESTSWEAKVRAGNKAIANEFPVIEDYLSSALTHATQHNVRCTWEDGNNPDYSYDDVVNS